MKNNYVFRTKYKTNVKCKIDEKYAKKKKKDLSKVEYSSILKPGS